MNEQIPALDMWKEVYETMVCLAKENKVEEIQKFAQLIQKKEFCKIFVYSKESGQSFEEFCNILNKYKSFTTWFLGHFFLMLTSKKLSHIDRILIDTQIYILKQLSKTYVHIYNDLSNEYKKAFCALIKFCKGFDQSMEMEVFIPEYFDDLSAIFNLNSKKIKIESKEAAGKLSCKLLHILEFILSENCLFSSFDRNFHIVLDDVLYLLVNSNKFQTKIDIFHIFLYMLKKKRNLEGRNEIDVRMQKFSSTFEQIIYDVFNKNVLVASADESCKFQQLVFDYLLVCKKANLSEFHRISNFINSKLIYYDDIADNLADFCAEENPILTKDAALIKNAVTNYKHSIIHSFEEQISNDLLRINQKLINVYDVEISASWNTFYTSICNLLDSPKCDLLKFLIFLNKTCHVLINFQFKLKKRNIFRKLCFFNERELLLRVVQKLNMLSPNDQIIDNILQLFLNLILTTTSNYLNIYFHILKYSFDHINLNNNNDRDFKRFWDKITPLLTKENTSSAFIRFTKIICSGITFQNETKTNWIDYQNNFFNLLVNLKDDKALEQLITIVPHLLSFFTNGNQLLQLHLKWLTHDNEMIIMKASQILPTLICLTNSDYKKVLDLENIEFECNLCQKDAPKKDDKLYLPFTKIDRDLQVNEALKCVFKGLQHPNSGVKIMSLDSLPTFARHIYKFHSATIIKIWAELAADQNSDVRKKFASVLGQSVKYGLESPSVNKLIKPDIIDALYTIILKHVKNSLQNSNYDLQDTLLQLLGELSQIQNDSIMMKNLELLIYYIMIPTSKYQLIAIGKCLKMMQTHDMCMSHFFGRKKSEICKIIVHLCVVNYTLIGYNLQTSLAKVSVMLGYLNYKHFLAEEYGNLLPFLVTYAMDNEVLFALIAEIATVQEVDAAELLANKYGNIFIHIFLNETDQKINKCLKYLEDKTKMSGVNLREKNFKVILNKVLINFHEKRDRVMMVLALLAKEDSSCFNNIREHLQSKFLGILSYFDIKLTEGVNSNMILLSLADILRYMGPKYIASSRFKIIAMLRTTNFQADPEYHCTVWDAFIRSSDVALIGPQLATIFASILPLLDKCEEQVNAIMKYLILDNINVLSDYIPDLFFINDHRIHNGVRETIQKFQCIQKNKSLKEKIQTFLKYFNHETSDVRIQSLQHIRKFIKENREELDDLVLGYNGIDPTIVELLDNLILGCRDKNDVLKSTCAEVIGELGAIEPSHLPRKYAQDNSSFTFFMDEETFIINVLNELLKSFQTDKNTKNVDRFALAMQEILKTYGISDDRSSSRYTIWDSFTKSQKEVMLPLLSSRYVMAQAVNSNFPCPIYGSNIGTSYQDWLYNWICCLISTLPNNRKLLLQACLPSIKNDDKILMHFLPLILVHSLLEGGSEEKAFTEFQAVINSFDNEYTIDKKVLNTRSLPMSIYLSEPPPVITSEKVKRIQCSKIVFVLIDFLDRWLREWLWQKGQNGCETESYRRIKNFTKHFNKLDLATCNYKCGEFPRALMYLEDYITENWNEKDEHLTFLAEIYAQLDESDGVSGVIAIQQKEPPIEQRILELEVTGKLADAAAAYERMSQPLKLVHIKGLMQCYLDLDNVNTALNFVKGAYDNQPDFGNMLLEMQAEPLFRLGKYEELDNLLRRPELAENHSWGVQLGKALLHFKNNEHNEFKNCIDYLKRQQIENFGASSLEVGVYQHGYKYITRLHSLMEIEQIEKLIMDFSNIPKSSIITNLKKEWDLRIKVVQGSSRLVEPVLCLRRVALDVGRQVAQNRAKDLVPLFTTLLGDCWLQSVQTARKAGGQQQAYTYALKAEEFAPPKLFIEKAKLFWTREECEHAITTLERGTEILMNGRRTHSDLSSEEQRILAEAKLLIASYNDAISNVDVDLNSKLYREAQECCKTWEKSLVRLAQYYDKVNQSMNHDQEQKNDSKKSDIQLHIINSFGKSLQYGTKYIYQSVPRLFQIWFDYGTQILDITSAELREERRTYLLKMTKLIDSFLERLPSYIFLTAFSQLVSRICHPQKEVYMQLKSIIIKLLQQYPQQTLWMIISVVKSDYPLRSKRCAEILNDSRLKTPVLTKLFKDFTMFAEKLIELCNKNLPTDPKVKITVSSLVRALPRMLERNDFNDILMPAFKFRKIVLPNPDLQTTAVHNVCPVNYVYITGINEEITVLPSLQKPRKITLRGSDGKNYIFMLKSKDDLRKDFRLMEFNDVVNQLLSRAPEARERRLNIRLYSVAPLNEECGLIEWVPNLVGLRPVLMELYKQRGFGLKPKVLRELCCQLHDPLSKKRAVFVEQLLPKHPPVLGEWFRKTFPCTQNWLIARTAYIRTTAVMSMVGYILGLGDRHGENILLDSLCGDVVHVDFNCLFNKGETFDWPERVPFRLTHNMIAAMGPLGIEGVFRKSCACTLRVLRSHSTTLMSIVTPFVYDPLVSWQKCGTSGQNIVAEKTNEKAVEHIKNIELRLQGIIKTKSRLSIPLSIEGHTNNLINEAISTDNLCQMYVGWGAYL